MGPSARLSRELPTGRSRCGAVSSTTTLRRPELPRPEARSPLPHDQACGALGPPARPQMQAQQDAQGPLPRPVCAQGSGATSHSSTGCASQTRGGSTTVPGGQAGLLVGRAPRTPLGVLHGRLSARWQGWQPSAQSHLLTQHRRSEERPCVTTPVRPRPPTLASENRADLSQLSGPAPPPPSPSGCWDRTLKEASGLT